MGKVLCDEDKNGNVIKLLQKTAKSQDKKGMDKWIKPKLIAE